MQPSFAEQAHHLRDWLELSARPVGVFLLEDEAAFRAQGFHVVERHRYCQAVMWARRGHNVILPGREMVCPAAAAAFGFKELPERLRTGKGLMGFGIVHRAETGKRMFDGMERLPPGKYDAIALCPLDEAPRQPDVVLVEDKPENLMWLLLADVNRTGGRRRSGDTAVLQAVCVDATIIPFVRGEVNFSLGCYGCREATDVQYSEAVLGIPGQLLEPLMQELAVLAEKAMPRSRSKTAFHALECRLGEEERTESPFENGKTGV